MTGNFYDMGKGLYGCTKLELTMHVTGATGENASETGAFIRQMDYG
jgi:hypothetical protein